MSIHKNALMELQGCQGSGQECAVAAEMHVSPVDQQPDFSSTASMGVSCCTALTIQLCIQELSGTPEDLNEKKKIKLVPFASRRLTLQESRAFNRSMEMKPFQCHKMRWSKCNLRPPDMVQLLCLPPAALRYGQGDDLLCQWTTRRTDHEPQDKTPIPGHLC